MVRRNVGASGTVTIPKQMRQWLGITGGDSVTLDTGYGADGVAEVAIRKDTGNGVQPKHLHTMKLISLATGYASALVQDGKLLALTDTGGSEDFRGREVAINERLAAMLGSSDWDGYLCKKEGLHLVADSGDVLAAYKINDLKDGHFLLVSGTNRDTGNGVDGISMCEMHRRFKLAAEIVTMEHST